MQKKGIIWGKKSKYIFFVVLTLVLSVSASLLFNSQYKEDVDLNLADSVTVYYEPYEAYFDQNKGNASLISQTATTDVYRDSDGGLKLVIGETKYFNRSDGKFYAINWTDQTEFTADQDKLSIKWLDKQVDLEIYTDDGSDKKELNKDKGKASKDSLKLDTRISKESDKLFRYEHNMDEKEAEKIQKFGYKIASTNADCSFDGQDLVCDEQRISFKETIDLQGFAVSYDEKSRDLEISKKNQSQSLKYIDPTLTINSNTDVCGLENGYDVVVITNGATVTICDYDGTATKGYWDLQAVTDFDQDAGTTITGVGKGYRGSTVSNGDGQGTGGGHGTAGSNAGGGGGGYGGEGGDGTTSSTNEGGTTYGDAYNTSNMGSGGGCGNDGGADNGGDGGGWFRLNATGSVIIDGIITVDGADGVSDEGGGGSGGGIWIKAGTLAGAGTLDSDGGAGGGGSNYGGGGGGGRIYLEYGSTTDSFTMTTYGGNGGTGEYGGAGTISRRDIDDSEMTLIIDNTASGTAWADTDLYTNTFKWISLETNAKTHVKGALTVSDWFNVTSGSNGGGEVELTGSYNISNLILSDNWDDMATSATLGDLRINSGATFNQHMTNTIHVTNDVIILGTLTHEDATSGETINGKVLFQVDGDLTVASGATINVDGKGYIGNGNTDDGEGTGGAGSCTGSSDAGGGGGYGGFGGYGQGTSCAESGSQYGAPDVVTDLGSGGGGGNSIPADAGTDGGGYIKLNVTGILNITGTLSADGIDKTPTEEAGAGSGGGIWLIAGSLVGAGSVSAEGGDAGDSGGYCGGGGSGGRILIDYTTDSSTITYSFYGGNEGGDGSDCSDGASGTLLKRSASQTYGDLFLANNNNNDPEETNITSNFETITVSTGSYPLFYGGVDIADSLTITSTNFNALLHSTGYMNVTNFYLNDPFTDDGSIHVFNYLELNSSAVYTQSHTNTVLVDGLVMVRGELTHSEATASSTVNGHVNFKAGNFTIASGGKIDVDYHGYIGKQGNGEGTGGGLGISTGDGGGGGYGGWGGSSGYATDDSGKPYGAPNIVVDMGSGGGAETDASGGGGDGGGYIKLNVTDTLNITGTITADGQAGNAKGNCDCAGGSGGGVFLITNTLTGTGSITTDGGVGYAGGESGGGAGSGGRIHIQFYTDSSSLTVQSYGGDEGDAQCHDGAGGTILLHDLNDEYGDLYLKNNNHNDPEITQLDQSTNHFKNINIDDESYVYFYNETIIDVDLNVLDGAHSLTLRPNSNLTVFNNANINESMTDSSLLFQATNNISIYTDGVFTQNNLKTIVAGDTFHVYGTAQHTDHTSGTEVANLLIKATNFNLHSGGKIDLLGRGYPRNTGIGAGETSSTNSQGGGGGAYGGAGGDGASGTYVGGTPYGGEQNVTDMGSGGGDGDGGATDNGGDGGGYIFVNATNLITIDGTINANGTEGDQAEAEGGGGSGGGVFLLADTIAGSGSITACGGDGTQYGGGGGGGRIYLGWFTSDTSSISMSACTTGTGSFAGEAGTALSAYGDEDYWILYMIDPTTANPVSVEDGDNVSLQFWIEHNKANVTSGLSYNNITIAGFEAPVIGNIVEESLGSVHTIDFENFELGAGDWNPTVAGDQFDWTRDSGGTPSSSTGCSSGAESTTWYYFIETSSGSTNDEAWMDYATVNTDTDKNISISFWRHMYGTTINTLSLQIETDAGYVTLWSLTGNQGNTWYKTTVTLNETFRNIGNKTVRFVGSKGTSYTGDICIDQINISNGGGTILVGTEEFGYLGDGIWEANVTVPSQELSGVQDLFMNMSDDGNGGDVWHTETDAISYPAGFNATTKDITDTISVADGYSRRGGFGRETDQTMSVSDSSGRTWSLIRIFTDTLNLDSLTSRLGIFFKISTITTTIGDAVQRIVHFFRSPSDALGISDIVNRMAFMFLGVTQSLTLTDSASRRWAHTEGVDQGISMTDSVGRALDATRTSAQAIGLGDGLNRVWFLWRSFDDSLSIDPTTDRLAEMMRDPETGLILTTITGRTYYGLRALDDSLQFTTISGRLLQAGRSIYQTFTIQTLTDRTWTLTRAFSDTFSITVLTERTTGIFRNPFVEVTIGESVDRVAHFFRSMIQNIVVILGLDVDYQATLAEYFETVSVDIQVSPLADVLASMFRDLNQGIGIDALTDRISGMFRGIYEIFSFADSSGRVFFGIRTSDESITVFHTTDRMAQMWTIITQIVGVDPSANRLWVLTREIQQSFTFGTLTDRTVGALRSISQGFSIDDNVYKMIGYLRKPSDIMSFNIFTDRIVGAKRAISDIMIFDVFGSRIWYFTQGIGDVFGISDSSGRTFFGIRGIGDSFSFTTITSRSLGAFRSVADMFSLDTLANRFLHAQRSLYDLFGIDPTTHRIWFLNRGVSDQLQLSDSSGRLFHAFRISDISFSISDVTGRIQYLWRIISLNVGFYESVGEPSGILKYFVKISDSISIDAVGERVQFLWRSFTDLFSISEDEGKSYGTSRSFSVSIAINEAIDRTSSFVRSIWDIITWILGIGGETTTPEGTTPITPTSGAGSPQPKIGEITISEALEDHQKLERAMLSLKIMLWLNISLLLLLIILATDIARRNEKMGVWAQLSIVFIGMGVFGTLGFFAHGYITDHVTPDNGYHGMVYAGCWILAIVVLGLVCMGTDVLRRKKVISGWNQALTCFFTAIVLFYTCWYAQDWILGMSVVLNLWILILLIIGLVGVFLAFLIDMIRHF